MTVTMQKCGPTLGWWMLVTSLLMAPIVRADSQDNNNNSRDDSQDQDYYNNNYNEDNDGNGNVFSRFADRMSTDVSSMWQSAPNEWVAEYWEVFVVLAILTFVLLALHCCIAYDMCCGTGMADYEKAKAGGRVPLTREQLEERKRIMQQEKEQKTLAMEKQQQQPEAGLLSEKEQFGTALKSQEPLSSLNEESKHATAAAAAGAVQATTKTREVPTSSESKPSFWNNVERKSRKMYRVGAEVVSVWSEFLGVSQSSGDAAEKKNNDDNFQYRRQHDDPTQGRTLKKKHYSSRQHQRMHRRSDSGSTSSRPMTSAASSAVGTTGKQPLAEIV